MKSLRGITLSSDEQRCLRELARGHCASFDDVVRARVILLAAEGLGHGEIEERLDVPSYIVEKWTERFLNERMAVLSGTPRR